MNDNDEVTMKHKMIRALYLLAVVSLMTACESFVDVGAPENQIGTDAAFATDENATSVILGLYAGRVSGNDGIFLYYSACLGNSADEMVSSSPAYSVFMNNAVPVTNFYNAQYLWKGAYEQIAQANFAIAGLEGSTTLTEEVKGHLLGEAKFWRAFCYFYLVNIYGKVPLILGTNAPENAKLPRHEEAEVWQQITSDLQEAVGSMSEEYPGNGFRTRVNKSAAQALLARVYLYQKNWEKAEEEATDVIDNADYALVTADDLTGIFQNYSDETIFQVFNMNGRSSFASNYIPLPGSVPQLSMREAYYESFETEDQRRAAWLQKIVVNGSDYYQMNKYTVRSGFGEEYDIVLRLPEVYLIRAEARAHLNKLDGDDGAIADINRIRERAGLAETEARDLQQVLQAIEKERKHELFGEFGHRWLDLKRMPGFIDTGKSRAEEVLGPLKEAWKNTALLYPIPQDQIRANTNLVQNDGY